MTTTIYNLRSDPKRSLDVPTEHHEKASRLVQLALKSKDMNELYEKMKQEPSLDGIYIPNQTVYLVHKKKGSLKLQDEVYLETCVHLANDELAGMDGDGTNGHAHRARERYNAIRNKESIVKTLKSL